MGELPSLPDAPQPDRRCGGPTHRGARRQRRCVRGDRPSVARPPVRRRPASRPDHRGEHRLRLPGPDRPVARAAGHADAAASATPRGGHRGRGRGQRRLARGLGHHRQRHRHRLPGGPAADEPDRRFPGVGRDRGSRAGPWPGGDRAPRTRSWRARPSASQAVRLPGAPILLIFLLSGAAGLVYEVVWARQLVLVFGNTTQAVSAILTGYFGGLALGSFFGGRIADRMRRPLRLYGFLELLLVVIVLLTPLLFRSLDDLYRPLFAGLSDSPTILQLVRYGLALLALAPATILMGATLPTLARYLARRRSELGSSFGRLYAANTIGAIAGTLVAGLVLIELLGLTATLVVGAIGSATAGLSALAIDRRDASPAVAPPPRRRTRRARRGRPHRWRPLHRARRGLRVGPHVAGLPAALDADAGVRVGQHDLRLHPDPGHLPGRHRGRRRPHHPPGASPWLGGRRRSAPSRSVSAPSSWPA